MRRGDGGRLAAGVLLSLGGFLAQAYIVMLLRALGLEAGGALPAILADLAGIVGWLSLAWLGALLLDATLERYAALHHAGPPPRLVRDLIHLLAFGAAILAIVGAVFHEPVSGLVTTSGVLVAVIGFALRNMIADLFSGIAINVEHPYRIGDWVEVAPHVVGQVVEINWRATRLMTRDCTCLVVPNGLIANSRFVNFSCPEPHYRANLHIDLDTDIPVERARRVLLAAVLGCPDVLQEPRPQVQVENLDERGVSYVVRYWVADFAAEASCRDAVFTACLHGLREAGLAPALAKRQVTVLRPRIASAPLDLAGRLASLALFSHFAPAELAQLAAGAEERRFREGEAVVVEGAEGASLFVLVEGALDVWGGKGTVMLGRMLAGDVFGEISLLTGQPRSASVVAATEAILFEIHKAAMEPILRARPELAEDLARLMIRRQVANRERLTVAASRDGDAEARNADHLLRRLRAFFGLS